MAEKSLPFLREKLSHLVDEINGKASFLLLSFFSVFQSRTPSPRSQSAQVKVFLSLPFAFGITGTCLIVDILVF